MVKLDKENIEDVFPISDISQGILFHAMKDPSRALYHEQIVFQVPIADFDSGVFDRAFGLMVDKHANLRSNFNLLDFDEPLQIVFKKLETDISHTDISGLSREAQEAFIKDFMKADREKPFALATGKPLWRVRTFLLNKGNVCVLWINHHAIIDGWSTSMVMTELHATYHLLMKDPGYKPASLKSAYKDFIVRQRAAKKDEALKAFWIKELAGFSRFTFPGEWRETDHLRTHSARLSSALLRKMRAASVRNGISVRSMCFSAYAYALYMVSYDTDFVAGIISNNRPVMEDGDKVVGCFLNTVPVRIRMPEGITWTGFVNFVNDRLLEIRKYEALSYKEINNLEGIKEQKNEPVLDTFFNYTDFFAYHTVESDQEPAEQKDPGTLNLRSYEQTDTLLDFNVDVTSGFMHIDVRYFDSVMPEAITASLTGYFERFLQCYLEQPDQVASKVLLMGEAQSAKVLKEFNNTTRAFQADKTILELFEEQARLFPHRTALVAGDRHLTYQALDQRSNAFAKHLLGLECAPGAVAAIAMERSHEMMIAIFGVLKAGMVYMPIDPNYPEERLRYLLADSNAAMLLTSGKNFSNVPEGCRQLDASACIPSLIPLSEKPLKVDPSQAAYVIYTSGSTGRPKGVIVDHRSIVNRLEWMQHEYKLTTRDRLLQKTPQTFDVSVWELFWWSLYGASLYLLPSGDERNPQAVSTTVDREGVTVMHFVPSLLDVFCEYVLTHADEHACRYLEKVVVSGEKLLNTTHQAFTRVFEKFDTTLINLYGPTEATVDVTFHNCKTTPYDAAIPIGRPIDNTQMYVLSKDGDVQPIGIAGELYIGGTGVARGYVNKPELTADRFVTRANVGPGRLYRTGDIARWLPDGELEFIGRQDTQVKIKGVRIELGEIEATLKRCPAVKHAKVLASKNEDGNDELTAFVVGEAALTPDQVKTFLSRELPYYAIPSGVIMLENLLFTPNGKVDNKALLALAKQQQKPLTDAIVVAPANATEEIILAVWRQVLKRERIGMHDNFFNVGGDSIKLLKVFDLLKKYPLRPFQVVDLFRYTTISALAAFFAAQIVQAEEESLESSFDELISSSQTLLTADE